MSIRGAAASKALRRCSTEQGGQRSSVRKVTSKCKIAAFGSGPVRAKTRTKRASTGSNRAGLIGLGHLREGGYSRSRACSASQQFAIGWNKLH